MQTRDRTYPVAEEKAPPVRRTMNYQEARVYLGEMAKYGSVLGLETMKELLTRLGNPQDSLRFIYIGGTNGKGSVLAYVSEILKEAGYRVGRYLSPTLFSRRENIQVNGEMISREDLARLATKVREASDRMQEEGLAHPTVFEMETAIGFLYFQEQACGVVVLETGFGGSEDATNVVKTTVLEILTSISMDHTDLFGSTVGQVAKSEAGIIKPGARVVSAWQEEEAWKAIQEVCQERKARLTSADCREAKNLAVYGWEEQSFSYGGFSDLKIRLAGVCQIENAALAVEAVKALREMGWEISEEALRRGLYHTRWKGRFTVLSKDPVLIIDGAHNPGAAKSLRDSLERYFAGKRLFYIFGVFRDKDYREVIRLTADLAEHITAVQTPGSARALPAEELAGVLREYHKNVSCQPDIRKAVEENYRLADRKDDVIIAFGSLSFLGAVEKAAKEVRR